MPNIHQHHGRLFGYILRRGVHVAMAFIPILYYFYFHNIVILITLFVVLIIIEIIRLWQGWIVVGQRDYERKQISAMAWGAFGIILVLLFAPVLGYKGAAIAIPIIWSLALVDPFMGELRRFALPKKLFFCLAIMLTAVIWWVCSLLFGTPLWLIAVMSPLIVAAEVIKVPFIDDNFMILIIPLCTSIIIFSFLPIVNL